MAIANPDKDFLAELTSRGPRKKLSDKPSKDWGSGKGTTSAAEKAAAAAARKAKYAGKGARKGQGGKGGDEFREAATPGSDYRDRAAERREQKNEYKQIAEEWDAHAEVSKEESKYLGGTLDHTHLVKGLDYALLNRVRTEQTKRQKAEELQQMRDQRKVQKKTTFQGILAKKVWHVLVETLHPHHKTFQPRLEKMHKAISMGQKIRSAPTTFLPGRMRYEFDTAMKPGASDIPRIVYMSKEEAPAVDFSKKVGPVLPDLISRIGDSLKRSAEQRKQRKRDKNLAAEAAYTAVAQRPVSSVKARDADFDIFEGAGGLNMEEIVKNARPQAPASANGKRTSYFADAGDEKYQKAPEGQLELKDVDVDGGQAADRPAFEAAPKFLGARPGWVFKLGTEGLGYYRDAKSAPPAAQGAGDAAAPAAASASASSTVDARTARLRDPLRRAARGPLEAGGGDEDDDAYFECFPGWGLGGAQVHTGDADSDAEDAEGKKKKGKGAEKGGGADANKKPGGDGKKRKLTEGQEWQKIDNMIKKGKHGSMEEIEASVRKERPRHGKPSLNVTS